MVLLWTSLYLYRMHYFAHKRFQLATRFTECNHSWLFSLRVFERVNVNKQGTILLLENNIHNEINAISPEMLRNIKENVLEIARVCETENVYHLRDMTFHN